MNRAQLALDPVLGIGLALWLQPDEEKPAAPAGTAALSAGKRVFLTAGCATCHTLADAGATGRIGPNLDAAKPERGLVINRVTHGQGAMPAFAGTLSPSQIEAVADYVATRAGA